MGQRQSNQDKTIVSGCETVESCQDLLIKDGLAKGDYFAFDSALELLATHGGNVQKANVEHILSSIMMNDTSSSGSTYTRMMRFFQTGLNRFSPAEKERRARSWVAAGWISMIQYALAAGFFKGLDLDESVIKSIGDPTIRKLLSYEMESQAAQKIASEKCEEMDDGEISNIDVDVETINMNRLILKADKWDAFDPQVLEGDKLEWKPATFSAVLAKPPSVFAAGIESILQPDLDLDLEWFKRCNDYLEGLSVRDVYTMQSYSWHGDQIANTYCLQYKDQPQKIFSDDFVEYLQSDVSGGGFGSSAGGKTIPFFFQFFDFWPDQAGSASEKYEWLEGALSEGKILDKALWRKVVAKYVEDLTRIIAGAPGLTKDITVYRGTRSHYYSNKLGGEFYNTGFMSTSYMANVTQSFANPSGGCCLSVYKLKRGTKCMWMDPITQVEALDPSTTGEAEILLAPGVAWKIADKRVVSYNKNPEWLTAPDLSESDISKWGLKISEDDRKNKFGWKSALCQGVSPTTYDVTVFSQA